MPLPPRAPSTKINSAAPAPRLLPARGSGPAPAPPPLRAICGVKHKQPKPRGVRDEAAQSSFHPRGGIVGAACRAQSLRTSAGSWYLPARINKQKTKRRKTLREGESKANLFETNGRFLGEGAEDSSPSSARGGSACPLRCCWCWGRTALAASQSVKRKSARGKSSPASEPRGVCRSVQPMRSAIKCSKASRSPARLSRDPEGTSAGSTRSEDVPPAGKPQLLSVPCAPRCPGTPVYGGQGGAAARGRAGSWGPPGAGGVRQGRRHLGAAPGTHMQITCNLSSSMLPLSASWPSLLPSVSSSPRSISSSFPASGRVYAYPLMERQVKKTILFSLLL